MLILFYFVQDIIMYVNSPGGSVTAGMTENTNHVIIKCRIPDQDRGENS